MMGPGNGSQQFVNLAINTAVPMNDGGEAYNFFVRLDQAPGTDPISGAPISYTFYLCDWFPSLNDCCFGVFLLVLSCTITDPDTTCNSLVATTSALQRIPKSGHLLAVNSGAR